MTSFKINEDKKLSRLETTTIKMNNLEDFELSEHPEMFMEDPWMFG